MFSSYPKRITFLFHYRLQLVNDVKGMLSESHATHTCTLCAKCGILSVKTGGTCRNELDCKMLNTSIRSLGQYDFITTIITWSSG